jgi:non-ribosomal peptide synthase protein (TIGR01720 family)
MGMPGEIFLGGAGLARGYQDRPEQTAERFVPDPFGSETGGRLYRTGDLARWDLAGELGYLGRIDTQIKVRGFRIEIGEIEVALARHPAVQEAVVSLRGDLPGGSELVAYVVPAAAGTIDAAELFGFLRQCLPAYMVPAVFLCLESLPLTANGKVDRRALSSLPVERRMCDAGAPRTPAEVLLAGIWCDVLGFDNVGIHENFFRLGGDSILSLRIVARAGEAGYRLTPKHMFLHPTIAELAAVLVAGGTKSEWGPVLGPVPLTPIQRWFFAAEPVEPHHWNQAVLLEIPTDLDLPALTGAARTLINYHDALRLRFRKGEEGWEQWSAAPELEGLEVARHDLSEVPDALLTAVLEKEASALQASLDLTCGPLLRIAFFDLGKVRAARLLILVHHLAVDVVSWRILIEDLERGYRQLCAGEPIRLPAKTSSYKQWAEHLATLSRTEALAAELAYWARLAVPGEAGRASGLDANTEASARVVAASLEEEETRALLVDVPQAYRSQISEVLLTALARGFARVQGLCSLRVDLEGHGREELTDGLDVSRTVGWFTALYPVLLTVDPAAVPGDSLKSIKEQLRSVPRRGLGYGLLRWLRGEERVAQVLAAVPPAEVSFNYLGQVSTRLSAELSIARESVGVVHSPRAVRRHLLEVSAVVLDRKFRTDWSFSLNFHSRPIVEALVNGFVSELRSLIAHCRNPEAGTFTPSDFPEMGFDQSELEDLLSDLNESAKSQ